MPPATKAAAQVIIKRPDGTESRFVRQKKRAESPGVDADAVRKDEDREAVAACPPYTASFNALLKEYRENNSRVLVQAVLDRMHAEAIPLNVVTYNLLMERVVCFHDDLIFKLYDEMKEEATKENSSVQPNLTTYQLLFRACERKGQYQRAFLFYKQLRDLMHIVPDSPTYDTLLGFCAAVRDVAQASYFMEEMKKHGVTPNVNTYNCMMSVLVDSAPYKETLRMFMQMVEEGIRPTIRTYNTLGKAARIHGDYDRAFQLFEEMKKNGMVPDVVTYNTLLCLAEQRLDYVMGRGAHKNVRRTFEQRKHGRKGIADLALTLFSEMESMDVKPNTFSFNQLMTVLLKCGDYRVFDAYRTMHERYNEVKDELELQLKRQASKKKKRSLSTRALDDPAPPREDALSSSTMSAGDTPVTLEEMMGMEDVRSPARIVARQIRPNLDTYRIILRACLQLGLASKYNLFYHRVQQEGLVPDHDMTMLMESICEANGDKVLALQIVEEAKSNGVVIDVTLFNVYLNVLASLGDAEMIGIVKEMELGVNEFNVRPNVETYNIMLRGYLCMQRHDEVEKLFSSMYLSYCQVSPNAETYCWVLRAYREKCDAAAATQLLESMRQRNIPVMLQHYHELMRVYLEADDSRIEDVFLSLRNPKEPELPKADTKCFFLVLQYYLRRQMFEELERLFKNLNADSEVEADAECYGVVLEMFFAQKRTADVKVLFTDFRMKCVPPSISVYNTLLRIFVSQGDRTMYEVLEDMKVNHVAPTATTLGILLEYTEGRRLVSTCVENDLFWNPATALAGISEAPDDKS
ncbi:uncharacterized protein Tco025E_02559 [Trypanosoma conorhini]|uniref:PROP1-like PPR domain-containing protein n=1 Tax=Trypanosoma conorhini TaxID=83891 RepID=A0A3S5IU23_9TRYP|nr:uncharacterized protein Tco025E_02559 [Trypanosoma conorhini]RNF24308.1 hypothetical protein Tco025E_02559 [Trypanosoma conorhini]